MHQPLHCGVDQFITVRLSHIAHIPYQSHIPYKLYNQNLKLNPNGKNVASGHAQKEIPWASDWGAISTLIIEVVFSKRNTDLT